MQWNVFLNDPNNKSIKEWNIFTHQSFAQDINAALNKCVSKSDFERQCRSSALYHFWSKSEYEVVITSWPPYITREEAAQFKSDELPKYRAAIELETGSKISVFNQLWINWDAFVSYCWSCRETPIKVTVKKKKRGA